MESSWLWALLALVAAGPGVAALMLLLLRRQGQVERDAQLEELRGLSREIVDAEMAAIRGQLAEVKRGRGEERAELARLREEVEGLRQGVAALLAQLRGAGLSPVWEPAPARPSAADERGGRGVNGAVAREEGGEGGFDRVGMQKRLARHFSLGDLEDLVFQLGVSGEEVWSESATLAGRARALVQWAERNGRTGELVAVCRELRKSVRW